MRGATQPPHAQPQQPAAVQELAEIETMVQKALAIGHEDLIARAMRERGAAQRRVIKALRDAGQDAAQRRATQQQLDERRRALDATKGRRKSTGGGFDPSWKPIGSDPSAGGREMFGRASITGALMGAGGSSGSALLPFSSPLFCPGVNADPTRRLTPKQLDAFKKRERERRRRELRVMRHGSPHRARPSTNLHCSSTIPPLDCFRCSARTHGATTACAAQVMRLRDEQKAATERMVEYVTAIRMQDLATEQICASAETHEAHV
jgi:hypothetical protein